MCIKSMYRKMQFTTMAVMTLSFVFASKVFGQQEIPLYRGPIPNSKDVPDQQYTNADSTLFFKISRPTLRIFRPDAVLANGTAIVVCPGGGYLNELMPWEGYQVAKKLNKKGITAFVLKYRLPSDVTMKDKSIGPLQDAQQAIYLVRKNASLWNIDPHKVGIMGFSAGGHLASTAGTHFEHPVIDRNGANLRPDFMVLVYPVISMETGITHAGSRKNLLGKDPSPSVVMLFSNDLQVDSLTPPAFLTVAEDDSVVPIKNSLLFFNAMVKYRNPVSLHVYQKGGHGFVKYPPRDAWMNDLFFWMRTNKWLP